MAIRLKNLIVLLTTLSLSTLAAEPGKLPLDDQLALTQKIEYKSPFSGLGNSYIVPFLQHDAGRGALDIEVDDLKPETCLKAVQEKIKQGYTPEYRGDFNNTFINNLMIGVVNLDFAFRSNDYSFRNLAFILKDSGSLDTSLPEISRQTRNVMICQVGISPNHQYIGLNFWQEILGVDPVSSRFTLLDNRGNILWKQETEEIRDPDWDAIRDNFKAESQKKHSGLWRGIPWSEGACQDKEPVMSFMISSGGHVLTSHESFGIGFEQAPYLYILRDKIGQALNRWEYSKPRRTSGFSHLGFSRDGSRLFALEHANRDRLLCVSTSDGSVIWEKVLPGSLSQDFMFSLSSDGSKVLLKEQASPDESKWILLDEKGEIADKEEFKIECQRLKRMLPNGGLLIQPPTSGLPESISKIPFPIQDALFASDSYYQIYQGEKFSKDEKGIVSGERVLLICDGSQVPVAHIKVPLRFREDNYPALELKKKLIVADEPAGRIYIISPTDFLEFEFEPLAVQGNAR